MNVFIEELKTIIPEDQIKIDEPMMKHTTFRVGGPADLLITPTVDQLIQVIGLCYQKQMPYTIIGNGSNLLVGDKGIRGLVIEIGSAMSAVRIEGTKVTAEAGALLSQTASAAAKESLGGFEFAHGIPGTVGGAVVMNAGAYDGEIVDVLKSVRVLNMDGSVEVLPAEALDLSYRHSCIPEKKCIVLEAELELEKKDSKEIYDLMEDLKGRRTSKQPLEYPSAGSTFKRPVGMFAGKLIQDCNLKGYTVGGAQVSEKHSGFVINKGGATAADIAQLIGDVQAKVKETFDVDLECEVKYLGEF